MKTVRLKERDTVLNILSAGGLKVDNKFIKIADELNKHISKEYRKENIDKINVNKFDKVDGNCKVWVLPCGSGDVPYLDEFKQDKVCILNFASSKYPGGGFLTGAHAQEENLCYHSNLHDVLSKHNEFYELNRSNTYRGLYLDGIIYSINVLFFRQNFTNKEPVFANVITCAAPNMGVALKNGVSKSEVENTMKRRLEAIMKVSIDNGNRTLVLGAFGCGVFKNDVKYVAEITRDLLFKTGYGRYFNNIIIPAISEDDRVYKTFKEVFKEQTNENNK